MDSDIIHESPISKKYKVTHNNMDNNEINKDKLAIESISAFNI